MTTTQEKRLDKVEYSLTPTQAVVRWLQQTRSEYASLEVYARSLKGQPLTTFPLPQLQERIRAAVAADTRGLKREQALEAQRRAERDVFFLYKLIQVLHERVLDAMDGVALRLRLLQVQGDRLADRVLLYGDLLDLSRNLGGAGLSLPEQQPVLVPLRPWLPFNPNVGKGRATLLSLAQDWSQSARATGSVIFLLEESVRAVEARYLAGQGALFPEYVERVQSWVEALTLLVDAFNEGMVEGLLAEARTTRQREVARLRVDLVAVREGILVEVRSQTSLIVDRAKAEALRLLGEHNAASDLLAKYVVPN